MRTRAWPWRRELGEIERQSPEAEGLDYVKVSLGLVFVFGAFVFGILSPPGTLVVSFGLMIPAVALIASALQEANKRRRALPPAPDKERELLSAIRDNGGVITPTEVAMDTSLTVKEADRMLSELAGGGHLSVESAGGTLHYSLHGKRTPELDEPGSAT